MKKLPEDYKQLMIDLAKKGAHAAAYAIALGFGSLSSFYNALRDDEKYPGLKEAYQEAKTHSLVFYEDVAKQQATGEMRGNPKSLEMILRNKHSDEYAIGTEEKSQNSLTINIHNMNTSELEARIKYLTQKHGLIENIEEGEFKEDVQ